MTSPFGSMSKQAVGWVIGSCVVNVNPDLAPTKPLPDPAMRLVAMAYLGRDPDTRTRMVLWIELAPGALFLLDLSDLKDSVRYVLTSRDLSRDEWGLYQRADGEPYLAMSVVTIPMPDIAVPDDLSSL